jgi:acetolactate synthase-1/2/3 large subunit
MTGAQALTKVLVQEGVTIVFGYPGGAIMPTYDALYDIQEMLRHILVRHEQGAVHAAEGYAKATGKVGVCIATSGPGATNLVTGLANAMLDSVPLVCVTGQVTSTLLGSDAFQEADIVGMSIPITKWNFQVTKASEIPEAMAKAFYIARSDRPGPVLVDITKDAQLEMFEAGDCSWTPVTKHELVPDDKTLRLAADLLNNAQKPFLLVGHGVQISGAEQVLITLAEKICMPMASTLLGLSAVPSAHPLFVGMLGMHGNYGPNILTNEADVIIAVGMRFDDRVTGNLARYAKHAKIIHIEVDPAEMDKNVIAEVSLLGDAKRTLESLLPLLNPHLERTDWLAQFKHYHQQEYDAIIAREVHGEQGALKMAEVVHRLCQKTRGEAVLVTDVGQHQMITARYAKFNHTRSFISSGGLGTMGYALPAAIGAKFGVPEKEVIAIAGDGGFQMNIQELGVLMQEKLPVKIIVLNNGHLGMVRQWQELFYDKRYSFVKLQSPDFVAVAKAYSIRSRAVSDRVNLDQALDEMLEADEPYLLEVKVASQENVFPMIATGKGVDQISLG